MLDLLLIIVAMNIFLCGVLFSKRPRWEFRRRRYNVIDVKFCSCQLLPGVN